MILCFSSIHTLKFSCESSICKRGRKRGRDVKGDVYDFMLFFNPYIEIFLREIKTFREKHKIIDVLFYSLVPFYSLLLPVPFYSLLLPFTPFTRVPFYSSPFTFTTKDQKAPEGYRNHGVFTYALLEAIKEKADLFGNKNGFISVHEVVKYV